MEIYVIIERESVYLNITVLIMGVDRYQSINQCEFILLHVYNVVTSMVIINLSGDSGDSLETPRGLLREPPIIRYSNGIMLQI